MNVCFFCGGFNTNGGIGRVTSILAGALSGTNDMYLCSFYEEKSESHYQTECCKGNDALFEGPVTMVNALLKKHAIRKLVHYFQHNKIQIVVACGALYFPLVVIAARICRIKVVCWEHISPTITSDYRFQKEARAFGTRFCDCNVVLTKAAEEWYNKNCRFKKLIQIYNPVDHRAFEMEQKPYAADSKKIISVGRLSYQKNFSRLIDIAAAVLEVHKDWTWDIYGEGEDRESLQEKIDRCGLKKRVNLCGQVENIYSLYSQYSMIVMTSRYEGFPMVLLEAAAFGLPMISFDIKTGPSEIIQNGINGFLCSEDSDEAMIEAITSLIRDDVQRKSMSNESRYSVKRFSMERICKQWIDCFNYLLSM